MEPVLLRMEEAARLAGLSRSTAYQLAASGALPVVRIGRSIRVPREALLAWVDQLSDGGGHQRRHVSEAPSTDAQ